MKITEAITALQKLKKDKQEKDQHQEMETHGKSMMGLKNVLVSTMVDLTKLLLSNRYEVVVKNFPKQDIVVNELKQMNTTLHLILLRLETSVLEPLVKSPKLNKPNKTANKTKVVE